MADAAIGILMHSTSVLLTWRCERGYVPTHNKRAKKKKWTQMEEDDGDDNERQLNANAVAFTTTQGGTRRSHLFIFFYFSLQEPRLHRP